METKRTYEQIHAERNPRKYIYKERKVPAYRQSSGIRFGYTTNKYTEEEYMELTKPDDGFENWKEL